MTASVATPTLLFDDECGVCRRVAAWVRASLRGTPVLVVRPIGNDPADLARLHPGLDIWDAYAIVHLLMPDGSMRTGGAAVAEVLRLLPGTKRLAPAIDLAVAGRHPVLGVIDAAYTVLAEIRPLLGCESCGSTNRFVQSTQRALRWTASRIRAEGRTPMPHLASPSRRVSRVPR